LLRRALIRPFLANPRQEKKLHLDKTPSPTPRERELIALFRAMTELDRRLLLSTAEKLISTEAV
jgi:hypothetical protein